MRCWPIAWPSQAPGRTSRGSRSGWNDLRIGGAIPDEELLAAVDASYEAVVSKLPRKDRPG
jgi:hypothetical protein